jgi:hypothetical protein
VQRRANRVELGRVSRCVLRLPRYILLSVCTYPSMPSTHRVSCARVAVHHRDVNGVYANGGDAKRPVQALPPLKLSPSFLRLLSYFAQLPTAFISNSRSVFDVGFTSGLLFLL